MALLEVEPETSDLKASQPLANTLVFNNMNQIPEGLNEQAPLFTNLCYSLADLERMDAWVLAVGQRIWTSDLLHGHAWVNTNEIYGF